MGDTNMRKIISVILAFLMMTCVASATISTTANNVAYTCTGTTGPFAFTFPVTPDGTAIAVTKTTPGGTVTTLTYSTDYTTTPVNASYLNGGSVTLTATCTSGYTLTIQRNTPQTQASSFTDGMPTLYKTFERSLDKLTMINQDNVYWLKGATGAQGPKGDPGTGNLSGPVTNDANYVPQWNGANSQLLKNGLGVGTSANQLVQLDASAKLPALDGSQLLGIPAAPVSNLKPVVNASVNKLDIFTKTGGAVPDTSNFFTISISDGNGYTARTRKAAYLSGTSQFILADAANYWSKGSVAGEVKTAYVYAIWDGTGIVWALAGYSGFTMVPATTTIADDDYFLLEASSTYTPSNSHYCACVAKIRYTYSTPDNPDHTILATVENAPQVVWNPKSDYGKRVTFATTNGSAADISEYDAVSVVVRQSGRYAISAHCSFLFTTVIPAYGAGRVRVGSGTYGSAVQIAYTGYAGAGTGDVANADIPATPVYLNLGDVIHLGLMSSAYGAGYREIIGDDVQIGATYISFTRID